MFVLKDCIYLIVNLIFLIYLYNVFLTLFAWKKIKFTNFSLEDFTYGEFAILIPCHNEESVIKDNLQQIYNSKYPLEFLNVYVIADNCSDNTVDICNKFKESNKNFKLNTIEVAGGSKPKAINCAIKHLQLTHQWTTDYIFILDSDNKVSPNIFYEYNKYHCNGETLLQCRILSDNSTSFTSKGFASSFNSMAFGFQYAKNRLGLSASLSGTGFSVTRNVWDTVGFEQCTTLTEDLEFSILCVLSGYKVKFIPNTYVLNQNVDDIKSSCIQRTRWCRGHMQSAAKLNKKVVKAFLKHPSLQLLDSFLFLNIPSKSVIYFISTIAGIFLGSYVHIFRWITILLLVYNLIFIAKCNCYKISYLLPHMVYSLTMHIIIIYGAITYKRKKWAKTIHKKIIPTTS